MIEKNQKLLNLATGFLVSRAVYAAAELGIADYMTEKTVISIDELAQKLDAHADSLYRLMRTLAGHGVFHEHENKHFSLTEIGVLMQTNHPQTLRYFLMHEDEPRWRAYGHLAETVKSGKPFFEELNGMPYYSFLGANKISGERFNISMQNFSDKENKALAEAYDFSSANIVGDIGGGVGMLLKEICNLYPKVRGVLYELPQVIDEIDTTSFGECKIRIALKKGSFLESVPSGIDIYILKRIMHNWDDERCITILKNCA
jgi:hypothetical protein